MAFFENPIHCKGLSIFDLIVGYVLLFCLSSAYNFILFFWFVRSWINSTCLLLLCRWLFTSFTEQCKRTIRNMAFICFVFFLFNFEFSDHIFPRSSTMENHSKYSCRIYVSRKFEAKAFLIFLFLFILPNRYYVIQRRYIPSSVAQQIINRFSWKKLEIELFVCVCVCVAAWVTKMSA